MGQPTNDEAPGSGIPRASGIGKVLMMQRCQHNRGTVETQGEVAPLQTVTTRDAATQAGLTLHGMRLWFQRYPGLAVKVGGRWKVNAIVLSRLLAGVPPRGDRHHGENTEEAHG